MIVYVEDILPLCKNFEASLSLAKKFVEMGHIIVRKEYFDIDLRLSGIHLWEPGNPLIQRLPPPFNHPFDFYAVADNFKVTLIIYYV